MSVGQPEQLPSLDLLRQLTARHVFEQVLGQPLTRAEIAATTGISKPTISESVRRLLAAGVLTESGRQLGKRGPAGTLLTVRPGLATAVGISTGPDGVLVETFDLHGRRLNRIQRDVPVPVDAARLNPVVLGAVRTAVAAASGLVRGCAVSVAGPVDQRTHQLVRMPHAPFLLDEFSPRDLLGDLIPSVIDVDNDVNWAALAEHHHGNAQDLNDFVLCYLGAGVGGAMIVAGDLVHGHRGLAGELAHVQTVGPGGRSMPLIGCLAAWDLLKQESDAIDVDRVLDVLTGATAAARGRRDQLAAAVAGAISSVAALFDPDAVLIGGPWGGASGFADRVAERLIATSAVNPEIRPAGLGHTAPLTGIRIHAVRAARHAVAESL